MTLKFCPVCEKDKDESGFELARFEKYDTEVCEDCAEKVGHCDFCGIATAKELKTESICGYCQPDFIQALYDEEMDNKYKERRLERGK